MRHNRDFAKLGRTTAHRQALLRNMVTELFRRERIETTIPKAKALQRVADKMVTLAKRGDLHARRQALRWFKDSKVVANLFDFQVDQFRDRQGGYTRILRLGFRRGDNAPMGIIELVGSEKKFSSASPKKEGKKKAAKPPEKAEAKSKTKAAEKTDAAPTDKKKAKPKSEKSDPSSAGKKEKKATSSAGKAQKKAKATPKTAEGKSDQASAEPASSEKD